ncbi:hypothetical protein AMECASPLE_028105 [Ameca splendens]|uniref:Uncharacterized protein n=1 Tax=Ameca splendens TaxID=208324 RepID=A0ABV0ZFC4_9TELE
MFYWISVRGAWRPVNGMNSFILQELPAHSCHMKPCIIMHQEETRTHCTSKGSNSGFQGAIIYPIQFLQTLSHLSHELRASATSVGSRYRLMLPLVTLTLV